MSRFNISVLLATALLGVLLWVVISIVRDLVRAPDEPLPMPVAAESRIFDPSLPRLLSQQELEAWLTSRGQPAGEVLAAYSNWLAERGFPPRSQPLLASASAAEDSQTEYSGLDDTTLVALAGSGNISAMHELGARSLATDPLAALEWYDQAILNGSLYAMQRMADLLLTLGDPAIDGFVSNAAWGEALEQIRNAAPAPMERALAWSIAAVTAGGYAIMTSEHAGRIESLRTQLDAAGIDRACDTAQNYVLEIAAARRARGAAVFSMQEPPVALSVANPADVIPCAVKVPPLVSLNQCEAAEFVGPGPELMLAWLCSYP